MSTKEAIQSMTEQDYKIIALEATVAQQAQMIEHLRGGLGTEPQLVSYAEDMSTCTLTTGDGTGYFYDRVDPDQPTSGYTAADMANAARDGFRDGAASKEKIIDALLNHCEDGECHVCSQIICPHGEPLHFHHDGCPACAQDEPE